MGQMIFECSGDSKLSDIYYEVNIWLINLEYEDTHYTSNTMNIKEILDSKILYLNIYAQDFPKNISIFIWEIKRN